MIIKLNVSVLIDDSDLPLINNAKNLSYKNNRGKLYMTFRKEDKHILVHRVIMDAKKGDIVDHINGNTLDNRKSNLRVVKMCENIWNSESKRKYLNKYKGVTKAKEYREKQYRARVMCHGKRFDLGFFKTEEEAALAYNNKATELFGEFALLNNIDSNHGHKMDTSDKKELKFNC